MYIYRERERKKIKETEIVCKKLPLFDFRILTSGVLTYSFTEILKQLLEKIMETQNGNFIQDARKRKNPHILLMEM
jgi:hypothetical protein